MKKQTLFKIGFCVLLVAALAYGATNLHLGRNSLHASFVEIRNGSFSVDLPEGDLREYYAQRLKITLVNDNDYDVVVLGLRVEKGDESDFQLERSPEQTVTIPAHTSVPQSVWFRIVSFGPENEEVLETLRRDFSVRVVYADAAAGIDALDAADTADLKTEWVR